MQTNPESAAVEAVAWYTDDHLSDRSATTWDPETAARWEAKGWKVWMLYKGSDVMAMQARYEVALDALRGEVADRDAVIECKNIDIRERDRSLHEWAERAKAAERRVAELEAAAEPFVRFSSGERYIDLRMPTSAIERMRRLLRKDDALTKESQ